MNRRLPLEKDYKISALAYYFVNTTLNLNSVKVVHGLDCVHVLIDHPNHF